MCHDGLPPVSLKLVHLHLIQHVLIVTRHKLSFGTALCPTSPITCVLSFHTGPTVPLVRFSHKTLGTFGYVQAEIIWG